MAGSRPKRRGRRRRAGRRPRPGTADVYKVQPWATFFIDVLGWSSELLRFDDARQFLADQDRIVEVVKGPITKRELVRTAVQGVLNRRGSDPASAEAEFGADFATWTKGGRTLLRKLLRQPFVVEAFGDSFVVNVPCGSHSKFREAVPAKQIYLLLMQAACATAVLLSVRVPVRGAIEIGIGTEYRTSRAKGYLSSSVAKAYALEHTKADYLRILLGPDLVAYLRGLEGRKGEYIDDITGNYARDALALCRSEQDGSTSLDYLSPTIVGSAGSLLPGDDVVQKAHAFVEEGVTTAHARNDERVAHIYERAQAYFAERRRP
jgi:hypothetical protein